jgi:hypothetical protein
MNNIQLFETYKSQKELEKLASEIIKALASKSLNMSIDWRMVTHYAQMTLDEIDRKNYQELSEFIYFFGDLVIKFDKHYDVDNTYTDSVTNAYYKRYLNERSISEIVLIINPESDKELKYELEDEDYIDDENYLTHVFYSEFHKHYYSPLIHELQHAYDDYRSGGKALNKKMKYKDDEKKEREILSDTDYNDLKEEEKEFIRKRFIDYVNLPHEIDARFTQTINDIKFYEGYVENGEIELRIKDFDLILLKFKMNFENYYDLSDKDNRRLMKRLGKFYELEKEFIKMKNAENK